MAKAKKKAVKKQVKKGIEPILTAKERTPIDKALSRKRIK